MKWNREVFSKVEYKIKQKEKELDKLLSKEEMFLDTTNIERCQGDLKNNGSKKR